MKIANIVLGERVRQDLTRIEQLAKSIERVGLIQPPVVREMQDGSWRLVAGGRRIAAMQLLGWTETRVTVAHDLKDELTALMAEGEENTEREPFTVAEAVEFRRRIREVEAALAKERQREHGGTAPGKPAESDTSTNLEEVKPQRHEREVRHRSAKPTGFGATTLDKAEKIIDIAESEDTPEPVREVARESVRSLNQHGAKVDAEKRKVDEALARHIEGDQSVAAAAFVANFSKHLRRLEIASWDPEKVAELVDADNEYVIDLTFRQLAEWHQKFKNARSSGLRLVKGGAK